MAQIDSRLKQITGNYIDNFGGLDIIFIGDLRQLPPVRATPIYKPIRQKMVGPSLWRSLQFHELTEVIRQDNVIFSNILSKIGSGLILDDSELKLIESRFFIKEDADRLCSNGTRLYFENINVDKYNNSILNVDDNKIVCTAIETIVGANGHEQETHSRQKLHKLTTADTGGVPYEIVFSLNKYYLICFNIDTSDGLVNGAVGKLIHVEYNTNNELIRVWLEFPKSSKTGEQIRKKCAVHDANNRISSLAVPISKKSATITLNNNKTIVARRNNFPLKAASAITVHKSQGGTFQEIVYQYDKKHNLSLVYVALSRVTSLEGLYLVSATNDRRFYHGRRYDASVESLQN